MFPTLLIALAESLCITMVLGGLLWALWRLDRAGARRLQTVFAARVRGWHGEAVSAIRLPQALRAILGLVIAAQALILAYLWVAFILRRFPSTRPLGESLRARLLAQLFNFAGSLFDALPGVIAVLLLLVAARFVARAVSLLFDAAEQGRVTLPGVYPDTAAATRRLAVATVWLLALAVAYPYVPGGDSEAFKGLSVFVGVIISLGSTGVVQHVMSGLMLTFSRAVHVGDFARIGEVEGTVVQVGALATKLRTPLGEEVTIPNAVVVAQTTTNYTTGASGAALLSTSVTIGYDTPWRQVQALLLTAAERTAGVRREPAPFVWVVALQDFYIKYTLVVAPEEPGRRGALRDRLHTCVLDAFNEHGVQIMSPNYEADPEAPKVVPPSQWYAAPASPTSELPRAAGSLTVGS